MSAPFSYQPVVRRNGRTQEGMERRASNTPCNSALDGANCRVRALGAGAASGTGGPEYLGCPTSGCAADGGRDGIGHRASASGRGGGCGG
jgi:hypothetical protein